MIKRTCEHPHGCHRPHLAKGWCATHYMRVRTTGDPGPVGLLRVHSYPPGTTCTEHECTGRPTGRGLCGKHLMRMYTHGSPEAVLPRRDQRADLNSCWTGDEASYNAAHKRVRRTRGRAADHLCQHCDGPAAQWAYGHSDPDERREFDKGCELVYSPDPEHYIALCQPCHRAFDRSSKEVRHATVAS